MNFCNFVHIVQKERGLIVFYENFLTLCNQKGITPSAAAVEMGFQKSVVTRWKKSIPTDANKQKIAKYFGISVEELMGKEPEHKKTPILSQKDERDIARDLEQLREALESGDDLMFDGDPMSDEARESILQAMELGLRAAKHLNKEAYTPRKYRKD